MSNFSTLSISICFKKFIMISLLLVTFSAPGQEIPELSKLDFMIGEWNSTVTQVLRDGTERIEKGQSSISYALDSSYIQVKTRLCYEVSCRSYLQMIAYNAMEKQFESDYFLSNTHINIFEKGEWDEQSAALITRGINPWAPERENGINIESTFKVLDKDRFIMEVNELRGDKWSIGYSCIFERTG